MAQRLLAAARTFDQVITTAFPGHAEKRAKARMLAAQHELLASGYDAAKAKNQQRIFNTIPRSEDGVLPQQDLDSIRERSRNSFRQNSLHSGLIRRAMDNYTPIRVSPKTGDEGLDSELAAGWTEHCMPRGGWSQAGQFSFDASQRIVGCSVMRDGDLVAYKSEFGWQFFEGAQIGTPAGYDPSKRKIVSGVEYNATGGVARYWIGRYSQYGYVDGRTAKGLRADLCLHIGNREWLSTSRMLPVFWNSLSRFDDLDAYLETDLIGNMAAACVMGALESPAGPNALQALSVKRDGGQPAASSATGQAGEPRQLDFNAGTWVGIYPGEKVSLLSPNRQSANFPDYVRMALRFLGMQIGMPLEVGLMDFTQTNFAAAKMAMGQAGLTAAYWSFVVLGEQYITPVYLDWVKNQTRIVIPRQTKHPYGHELIPPPSPWIDMYKEALGINTSIKGGYESRTHAAMEHMSRNIQTIFRERAKELALAKAEAKAAGVEDHWREVLDGQAKEVAPDASQLAP